MKIGRKSLLTSFFMSGFALLAHVGAAKAQSYVSFKSSGQVTCHKNAVDTVNVKLFPLTNNYQDSGYVFILQQDSVSPANGFPSPPSNLMDGGLSNKDVTSFGLYVQSLVGPFMKQYAELNCGKKGEGVITLPPQLILSLP